MGARFSNRTLAACERGVNGVALVGLCVVHPGPTADQAISRYEAEAERGTSGNVEARLSACEEEILSPLVFCAPQAHG